MGHPHGIGGVIAVVVGSALYTWATLSFSYSTGDRIGFVQKLSKKGGSARPTRGSSPW